MLPDARALGALDATDTYGLEKVAWARLVGTGLGALAGSSLADRDERTQGALGGAFLGYLGGAGLSRLGHLGARAATGAWGGLRSLLQRRGGAAASGAIPAPPSSAPAPSAIPAPPSSVLPRKALPAAPGFIDAECSVVPPSVLPARRPQFLLPPAKLGAEKLADFNVGTGIPGTPLSVSLRNRDERLPGMHRWVDRGYIERAHDALDLGLEPADVIDAERGRGAVLKPLLGAGVGAALAHFGVPSSGRVGSALGGLAGAGVGAAINEVTAPLRERDSLEALRGVMRERANEPLLRGQHHATATAATPMLIAPSGGSQ